MPFDPTRLAQAVTDHLGAMPHPDVPELRVNQYEAFARVAARMFDNAQPEAEQVQTAFHALTSAGIAPAEFERLWDTARPLANVLLDRDPTMHDLMQLVHQPPAGVADYYTSHPHPEAPDVPAGKIATYHAHARPISMVLHGRDPNIVELHRFASGNYSTDDILAHYQDDGTTISGKQR